MRRPSAPFWTVARRVAARSEPRSSVPSAAKLSNGPVPLIDRLTGGAPGSFRSPATRPPAGSLALTAISRRLASGWKPIFSAMSPP